MNLIDFLRKAGADIKIRYNHEIIITWVYLLKSNFTFDIVSDYIESGTYMVIWALASKDYIDIIDARISDLYTYIEKLKEAWVKVKDLWNDILRVYKAEKLKAVKIQTNIFPGFPTDLQSPFTVLLTQAKWESKIHEVLFEWRLNFLVELEKMWTKYTLLNPHEAIISWPNNLRWWVTLTSWDLRAWAAVVIAWLIAEWETKITNIQYIFRWYENFVEKLQKLWADIMEQE
jgi:UDP-N-acetylglucosamine 1-carboxyvinyltransferase